MGESIRFFRKIDIGWVLIREPYGYHNIHDYESRFSFSYQPWSPTDEATGQGIGHKAFRKVYDELKKQNKISNIVGSWHKDEEFSYCQDGMSTNLRIFKENISNGMSESQSAFNTPTGKWVQKLGFTKCTVISNTNTDVKVVFSK